MIRDMTTEEKALERKNFTPCTGNNCVKKLECLRYNQDNKIFRLPSKNCVGFNNDLFKSMEVDE